MAPRPRVVCLTTSFPRDPEDPAGHFVFGDCVERARDADVEVLAPRPYRGDAPFRVRPVGGGELFAMPGAWARLRERPTRALDAAAFLRGLRRAVSTSAPPALFVAHWWIPTLLPLLGAPLPAPLEIRPHGADVRLLVALPAPARAALVARTLEVATRGLRVRFAAHSLARTLFDALPPDLARRVEASSAVEAPRVWLPTRDRERERALRAELGAGDEPLVCAVGRLVPEKRFDLALEAARRARARLVLVGDGPARPALERAAGAGVRFAGALPRSLALSVIATSDALVHPSAVEAAPTVVREARALGVPVVACAAGDVARWAAEDAGIRIARPEASHIAALLAEAAATDLRNSRAVG